MSGTAALSRVKEPHAIAAQISRFAWGSWDSTSTDKKAVECKPLEAWVAARIFAQMHFGSNNEVIRERQNE